MGQKYAHLSQQDPGELIAGKSAMKHSCSNNCDVCKMRYFPAVHKDSIAALAVVRQNLVVTGSKDMRMALHNVDCGEVLHTWRGHISEVTKLAYSNAAGSHIVYSGSRDATIRCWQFNQETPIGSLPGHQLTVSGLCTIQDNWLASGSRDASVRLWDAGRKEEVRKEHISRNIVTHMSFHAARHLVAQSSEDKELKLWDSRSLELVTRYPRANNIHLHCEWVPDGNQVITSSNGFNGDGCEISIWDIRAGKKFRDLRGHEGSVTGVSYITQHGLPNKKLLASCSLDKTVKLWNIEDGGVLWTEELPYGAELLQIAVVGDYSIVVTGGRALLVDLRLQTRAGRPFLRVNTVQKEQKEEEDELGGRLEESQRCHAASHATQAEGEGEGAAADQAAPHPHGGLRQRRRRRDDAGRQGLRREERQADRDGAVRLGQLHRSRDLAAVLSQAAQRQVNSSRRDVGKQRIHVTAVRELQ